MAQSFIFLLSSVITFLLTVLCARVWIPVLRAKKFGQKILAIGPRWHMKKEGTPTMGGIAFLLPILSVSAAGGVLSLIHTPSRDLIPLWLTLIYAALNALVGMIDDLTKFKKSQNQGLTPRQKLVLQVTLSGAYLALLSLYQKPDTSFSIPFTDHTLDLGIWYYILSLLLLVGIVNCANLTDGIDGLATSVAAILAGFFALAGTLLFSESTVILSGSVFGGAIGFLIFNYHPARVFMGDTGSLFFGAVLAGCSFLLARPWLILLAGFLYVLEGISVILQVLYFKITHGRRLFRMAPLHHHFERLGWGEVRIVAFFSALSLLFCAGAFCVVLGTRGAI